VLNVKQLIFLLFTTLIFLISSFNTLYSSSIFSSYYFNNDSAKSENTTTIKKIVIDPGHGGKDSGTMGTKRYKRYEKDIALDVSLKLGNYISMAFPNVEIIYTRKTDVFLELNERTEIANNLNADLFISVHCDGFTNPTPSGASVFVMGMSKLKANMDVAMRENSAIYMEDNYQQKYDGFDPSSAESYIVFSLMQNIHLNQSLKLAEEVEKEFSIRANRKSRGVKQAPFYVISRTNMPSILIECGFLTNPTEEDYLHSEIGQDYIASAIFRAFRSYKNSVEITEEKIIVPISEININNNILKDSLKVSYNVSYKVQIGTYLKSMLNAPNFKDLDSEEIKINGTFKYYVLSDNNKNNADLLKNNLVDLGFKGAFVVAFLNDKQISTQEALNLQNK
tara:strand:- start:4462 stop:5643 length:1182 start_codon:yes stop_codon:yes gene_type:complete